MARISFSGTDRPEPNRCSYCSQETDNSERPVSESRDQNASISVLITGD